MSDGQDGVVLPWDGWPLFPERDGLHAVKVSALGEPVMWPWVAAQQKWKGIFPPARMVEYRVAYVGPVLTPALADALRRTPTPDWRAYGEQVKEACAAACDAEMRAAEQDRHRALKDGRPEDCGYILWSEQSHARDASTIRALPLPTPPERRE